MYILLSGLAATLLALVALVSAHIYFESNIDSPDYRASRNGNHVLCQIIFYTVLTPIFGLGSKEDFVGFKLWCVFSVS